MKDLSIIISSCNRYQYLWDIQLQLLDKRWKHCPYDIYVVSENSNLPDMVTNLKLHNLNIGNESTGASDWSYMLETALKSVNSKYVLYMQEDYVLTDAVQQDRFESVFNYVKDNDIDYLRFYTSPPGDGEVVVVDDTTAIRKISQGAPWRGSLMLALWKTQTLMSLIEGSTISPWQFEQIDTNRFDKFYCIDLPTNDSSDVLPFLGMYGSTNGFTFYPAIIDLLNREGITKLDGSPINFNIEL